VIALAAPGVSAESAEVVGGTDVAVITATPDLAYGDASPLVADLNGRLNALGFNADDADVFDGETRHAVYAFQKHHELATDGVFTAEMWDLLAEPVTLPRQRYADRVEVDLGKQLLYVVEGHEVVYIAPISSGNGELYNTSRGTRAYALTPEGEYTIERNIEGPRRSFLGTLYDPYYFLGGFAVHGSLSVPNQPASHGCIRVTLWDIEKLKSYFFIDQAIYIYGDRTPILETYHPSLPPPLFD
jgi:peptidoglycan hydrolase-like protein with peptidoglycan-binding domain